jgi:oligopeptide transport system ATP-binding protein
MAEILLSIRDLKVHFPARGRGTVRAVDGVSLDIRRGETLGLVGESGCGKSTLGRAILRLNAIASGQLLYRGEDQSEPVDLATLSAGRQMRPLRRHMQMIFQDPYSSLDPRMSIGSIIAEPIRTFELAWGAALDKQVATLMNMVGLDPRYRVRYPHQLSSGQRQRVGIARALAAGPELIVADEPIAALDMSIQAQILNLLEQLRTDLGLTYLFISHDLRAVQYISNRVAVMYLGEIVELASANQVCDEPLMPYTRALISAAPALAAQGDGQRPRMILTGDLPSPVNPPSGCRFHTRCPYAIPACSQMKPLLREIAPGHLAACIRIGPQEPDIDRALEKGLLVQQS